MIIRNRIKCNHCGYILTSTSVHDFQTCSCGRVSVDGGHYYLKRNFIEPGDFTELAIVTEDDRAFDALKGGDKNDETVR